MLRLFSGAFLIILLSSSFSRAAEADSAAIKKIDSLLREIPMLMNSSKERANARVEKVSQLSRQFNYRHGIIEGEFFRAWYIYKYGLADECIAAIMASLSLPGIKSDPAEANFYILLGQCYVKKSEFDKAAANFEIARQISKNKGDKIKEHNAMVSMGWAYMESNHPREAIDLFNQVLKANPSEDYPSRTTLLSNIAACYNMLGAFKQGETYARQAVSLSRRRQNLNDLANSLNILARSLHETGNTQQAIKYLEEAALAREKVSDPAMLASDYLELASIFRKTGKFTEANMFAKKAEAISYVNRINLKLAASYEALAAGFEQAGDLKNAVKYYKKLKSHQDSTGNGRYEESLADLKVKYETERKESENLRLQQEVLESQLEVSNNQRISIGLAALILITLVGSIFTFVYLRNRYKAKVAIQKIEEEKVRMKTILDTEESERSRIAADLHDGVCQMLAAASMQLQMVKADAADNPALVRVNEMLEQTRKEVRAVSHQMTPELLLQHGLPEAIRQGVERLNETQTSTRFKYFEDFDDRPVDSGLALAIYRAFQELTSNILKHANASFAEVSLTSDHDEVTLVIEDNGCGFRTESGKQGLGLLNLTSRVQMFNGLLNIDSSEGRGTTVILKFDIPNLVNYKTEENWG